MAQNEHNLFVGNDEYTVKLIFSDYEGAINQTYGMVFHCYPKGAKEPKAISIAISSQAIDMWQAVGGNKEILEDKEVFAWQIVQAYLPQLTSTDVIKLFIHRDDNAKAPDGFTPIKAAPTISETARNIIFSGQKPTNNLIRREILKVCYNEWQTNPHGFVNRAELLKFVPVSEVELERNLDYLKKTYFIDGGLTSGGYLNVRITPQGIDIFEDPTEFERRFSLKVEQQTYNIGGDMIVTQLTGDNNQNIVKSEVKETAEKKKKSV